MQLFAALLSLIFLMSVRASQTKFGTCEGRALSSVTALKTEVARTVLACARVCIRHGKCNSANYEKDANVCVLFAESFHSDKCDGLERNSNTDFMYIPVPGCINGGQWNRDSLTCVKCDFGFTGRLCERHIIDCTEGLEIGYKGSSFVKIQPLNATQAFEVRCNFAYGGVTVIERRGWNVKCGSLENFNRTWSDYEKGFGDINCEFFIGLYNLYLMTSQRSTRLKIQMIGPNANYQSNYYRFAIDSEANNYTMHYGRFVSVDAFPSGDGFGLGAPNRSVNHSPFCTPDRDCRSCAGNSASGWWFNVACSEINLHTPLNTTASVKWVSSDDESATKVDVHSFSLLLFGT